MNEAGLVAALDIGSGGELFLLDSVNLFADKGGAGMGGTDLAPWTVRLQRGDGGKGGEVAAVDDLAGAILDTGCAMVPRA